MTGAVNVASGSGTRVRELVELIAGIVGRRSLLRIGAIPSGPEAPVVVADVRRLSEQVGWVPSLSLEDGVLNAVEWWRQTGA